MGCVERRRSESIGEGESIVTVNSTTSVKAQISALWEVHAPA